MKTGIKKIFNRVKASVGGGIAGAAAVHAGCIILPAAAALAGIGLSGAFLTGFMFVGAPVIAAGATIALNRRKNCRTTCKKAFTAAALALTATAGIHAYQHSRHENAPIEKPFDMEAFLKNRPICSGG